MVQNYIHNLQNELKMGKQPYRILQVVTIMNRGGIETMIMNHYRTIDRSKYQFDFLVHRRERGDYDDEIEQLGGGYIEHSQLGHGNTLNILIG